MSIKIITDSAADISVAEAKELQITVIPLEVTIEKKVYLDGVNLDKNEFYTILPKSKELPKTSQINPYRFEEEFLKLGKDDKAIVIVLSSKLSGTYHSAILAGEAYKDKVTVIDSFTVSCGERILVQYALQLIQQGLSYNEIVNSLEKEKKKIHFYAKLDTLKYLRKGGRISPILAFAGEALNIKPIIGIINGKVELVAKGRGIQNANKIISKYVMSNGGIDITRPFGTVYSGITDDMLKLYIKTSVDIFDFKEKIPVYQLGCTVGTHIGENGIGIAFFRNEK